MPESLTLEMFPDVSGSRVEYQKEYSGRAAWKREDLKWGWGGRLMFTEGVLPNDKEVSELKKPMFREVE